jgi:hypothetical protein
MRRLVYRRPGQAKREPGPITTNVHVARRCSYSFAYSRHRWLLGWTAPDGIDVPE